MIQVPINVEPGYDKPVSKGGPSMPRWGFLKKTKTEAVMVITHGYSIFPGGGIVLLIQTDDILVVDSDMRIVF